MRSSAWARLARGRGVAPTTRVSPLDAALDVDALLVGGVGEGGVVGVVLVGVGDGEAFEVLLGSFRDVCHAATLTAARSVDLIRCG